RLRKAQPLEISLREMLHAFAAMLLEAEQLNDRFRARAQLIAGNAGEDRVALQGLDQRPSRWDGDELRQISHPVLFDEGARREARDANPSVGRLEVAEQQRDQRALAGAVWAGEAKHFALSDTQ